MRPRRTTAGLLAAALMMSLVALGAVPGAGPASAATDSTPGYSVTHILVTVRTGADNATTCTVNGDIYKPDRASRRHKRAAILSTNGFGGSKDDSNETAIGQGFVRAGYVVLVYSGLGFGGSTCPISLDDPAIDGVVGKKMVSVLAGTRSYQNSTTGKTGVIRYVAKNRPGDPKVGMIGGSYGGEIQYAVAMQDPRVDAIIPIITWNNLAYSLAPNNTALTSGVTSSMPGVTKKEWVNLFFGDGIAAGTSQPDPTQDITACPNFSPEVCQDALTLNATGYPDAQTQALAKRVSVASYMKRIKVPTLLAQGEADTLFTLREAAATYRSLRAQHVPVRMIWQSWGHSTSTPAPGELDFSANSLRDSYEGRRFLDWMNHYVRGDKSAPVGPRFAYFRPWVRYDTSAAAAGTAVDRAFGSAARFSTLLNATLYGSGTSLVTSASSIASGTQSFVAGPTPTSYSETSGLEGSEVNIAPSDTTGTYASFTSPPLASGVNVVGVPKLTVRLSADPAADTQASGPAGSLLVFAKVYDVAPDGSTLTLPDRLIAPVRVPDVTKPVTITLPAVVHRFAAGHRIEVVLAGSDAAYANNAVPQAVTVSSSSAAPTYLTLPLRAGALRF
jgi:putative CocE/NonD family hydrolase